MCVREDLKPGERFKIFQRDGFRCVYCGRGGREVVLHVDHIVPVSKGGTNDINNLCTSCRECNIGKMTQDVEAKNDIKHKKHIALFDDGIWNCELHNTVDLTDEPLAWYRVKFEDKYNCGPMDLVMISREIVRRFSEISKMYRSGKDFQYASHLALKAIDALINGEDIPFVSEKDDAKGQ